MSSGSSAVLKRAWRTTPVSRRRELWTGSFMPCPRVSLFKSDGLFLSVHADHSPHTGISRQRALPVRSGGRRVPAAAQTEPRRPWPKPPRNFSALRSGFTVTRFDCDRCSSRVREFHKLTPPNHRRRRCTHVPHRAAPASRGARHTSPHPHTMKLRSLQVRNQWDDASCICPHESSTMHPNASISAE